MNNFHRKIGTTVCWLDLEDGRTVQRGTIIEWAYDEVWKQPVYLIKTEDGGYIKLSESTLL